MLNSCRGSRATAVVRSVVISHSPGLRSIGDYVGFEVAGCNDVYLFALHYFARLLRDASLPLQAATESFLRGGEEASLATAWEDYFESGHLQQKSKRSRLPESADDEY